MKKSTEIYGKNLGGLLKEVQIFDDFALCKLICDYYSTYESSVYVGDPELFKMIALSNEGREIYCTQSLYWRKGVPYRAMAALSKELDFKVLVFAASWDGFSTMAKRIENLPTKCTVKVFAVKNRGEDLDKGIIIQLIDWIENDNVPAEWKEEVKYKTIKRSRYEKL